MRNRAVVTAVSAVLLIALGIVIVQRLRASEDESPIVVKNGSINIETDGEWQDGGSDWINQTGGVNDGELFVKVTSSTGTCRASGKPVHIQYSEPSVHATFTISGMWWFSKTRVSPKSGIALVDGRHLRAGNAGDGGHITEVRSQSQTCSLSRASANVEINICSSNRVKACQ
jgi:hypothetical protein